MQDIYNRYKKLYFTFVLISIIVTLFTIYQSIYEQFQIFEAKKEEILKLKEETLSLNNQIVKLKQSIEIIEAEILIYNKNAIDKATILKAALDYEDVFKFLGIEVVETTVVNKGSFINVCEINYRVLEDESLINNLKELMFFYLRHAFYIKDMDANLQSKIIKFEVYKKVK